LLVASLTKLSVTQFITPVTTIITAVAIGFEFLALVVMKNPIFSDMTLCSLLKVNQNFRGTRGASACYMSHYGFLLGVFFNPEDGGNMFL
jgi:hypothetical protein